MIEMIIEHSILQHFVIVILIQWRVSLVRKSWSENCFWYRFFNSQINHDFSNEFCHIIYSLHRFIYIYLYISYLTTILIICDVTDSLNPVMYKTRRSVIWKLSLIFKMPDFKRKTNAKKINSKIILTLKWQIKVTIMKFFFFTQTVYKLKRNNWLTSLLCIQLWKRISFFKFYFLFFEAEG